MIRMVRSVLIIAALAATAGCQSTTSADDALNVDDFVNSTASPSTASATASTGRTYRVVRGNNQPDEILAYDWHAVFTASMTFNSKATNKDVDVQFPIRVTATTLVVKQASGGIVTPPTGGETEKYDFVINASGNSFGGVGSSISTGFEIWYDLPSLRREAVVTIQFSFVDKDNTPFTKAIDFNVAP